ncbi:MAG: hypothetical protein LBB63_01725 [Holosporaceae bacterium]|jgi:hypothetical protein|nr:hypothetical protein [Holosporaceae bacterium]
MRRLFPLLAVILLGNAELPSVYGRTSGVMEKVDSATQDSEHSVPIETPEIEEKNEFVIQVPTSWGYRTFKGKNGLIATLWPLKNGSYGKTDTAIFVFLQSEGTHDPEAVENQNIFTEKCPQATFKLAEEGDKNDPTKSISEKYFSGRCGRTMVLIEEVVENYTLVVALISERYAMNRELDDAKDVAAAYVQEIKKYVQENGMGQKMEKRPTAEQ